MDEKLNNNYRKNEPVMNSSKLGSDSVSNVKNLKNEADLLQQNSSTAESLKSEDNPNISHYRKWNAEDVIYNEGGDFKAELDPAQRHEYDSYFATQYSQDVRVQYPTDAVFRPPLVSTLQYKYNFLGTQLHRQKPSAVPPAAPLVNHDHHAQASNSSFHPNMWYPNAPYDSSSVYSCGQNRYPLYGTAGYINDHLVDMHHLSNSGREARNRAEKNRRDKLNGSIQELSTMVPHVAESPRRVDKTAVLRFAAHGLRLQYAFRDALNAPKPQLTDSLMKLLDSFFITLTCHGQIILISSSIEQHLGHCQTDLYGQNILHITHPEDHDLIRQQLIPSDLENLFEIPAEGRSEEPSQRTQAEEEYIDQKLREDKRSFTVRLARAGPRSESTSYEVVKIDGCFRRSDGAPRGVKTNSPPSGLQLVRRTQRREEALPVHTISGNDIVLIAIARVIHPPKLVKKMMDANSLEYKTRHLIDGRIIDCDQRIGIVAGYMTDEVRNLSPFTFMHQDDVRWVIVALRQMYDCNSSYGESTYRLLTRNGYFIYLLSKGYLEIDKETNTVHSFVCVNTLLDEEEGRRRVHEMKNKFSVIINKQIPSSSIDVPASENPQQLVRAVLCLIQNLQKTSPDDEEVASVSDLNNSSVQQNSCTTMSSSSNRSAKTPPLALVPPEPSSVKTSISKSVNVVNVTAAKHLLGKKQENKTPTDEGDKDIGSVGEDSYGCDCPHGEDGVRCEECTQRRSRISKLKRSIASPESADFGLMKRRFKSNEIQHVIFSSLDQLGRSLQEQQNAAIELQDQSNKFEVPNAKNRIKAIMEECQKQNEMYVNITSEIQSQGMEPNTTNSGADSQNAINLNQR